VNFPWNRTVDSILSDLTKKIDQLESHAQRQTTKAIDEQARAAMLHDSGAKRYMQVGRARAVAEKIKNLVSA
jgi:hypothetical protein